MASRSYRNFDYLCYSSVTWKIVNYVNGPIEVDAPIESPEFKTHLRDLIKWRLAIIRRVRRDEEEAYSEVILRRSPSCRGPQNANVRVRIVMVGGKGMVCYKGKASFAVGERMSLGSSSILKDVMDAYKPSLGDSTSTITITCDFLHDNPFNTNIGSDLDLLSNDLKKLHSFKKLTNLDLKLGKDIIPVHIAIVKARSSYIARILNCRRRVVGIGLTKKCSKNQLCALIEYWYTGDIGQLPRTNTPSNLNFMLNMEELGLRRYISAEAIMVSTTFKTTSDSFEWVIEDSQFCEKLKHLDELIEHMHVCEKDSRKLSFYPKGPTGNSDYISLTVEIIQFGSLISNYLEIYLMAKNVEYGCKSTFSWLHKAGLYEFPEFMKHDEFVKLRKTLLEDNKLRIGCRITRWTGKNNHQISLVADPDISSLPEVHPYITLANDMRNLLESGDSSDISLKARDRRFRVHKAILAARSGYFKELFDDPGYEDTESGEIDLGDVDPDDIYKILKYMYYAEQIELQKNPILQLYPVLDKYNIFHLKGTCLDFLKRSATREELELIGIH